MLLDLPPCFLPSGSGGCPPVDAVGHAAQGNLPQSDEIRGQKKVPQRPLRLSLGVYLAFAQAGYKLVWLQINQFHLIGPVKHAVGYALAHHYSGHGGNHIVEAFQMLHVNRGPYGYARLEQFLHILKALEVAAALRVGVGKLVHKGDFRPACPCS